MNPHVAVITLGVEDLQRARAFYGARPTSWGGYGGYFADPEGYLWEVATGATQLPFSE
jgi:uncharacterized glyoxalase superfamily protein PhnB